MVKTDLDTLLTALYVVLPQIRLVHRATSAARIGLVPADYVEAGGLVYIARGSW